MTRSSEKENSLFLSKFLRCIARLKNNSTLQDSGQRFPSLSTYSNTPSNTDTTRLSPSNPRHYTSQYPTPARL